MKRLVGAAAAVCLLVVATACAGGGSEAPSSASGTTGNAGAGTTIKPARAVYPGTNWATTTPAAAGLDQVALDEMAAQAEAAGSNCLLVVRDGKLVQEWYWNGTNADSAQEVFSATKSYTSTLVGIAQADGKLSINDSASKYIPEWKGTPAEAVTVQDLLSNDSGRHWDARTDYTDMTAKAPDKTAFAIGLAQDDAPGNVWAYNNSAIQTLSQVLRVATGEDPAAYAKEHLLDPIGMARSEMTHDKAGNTLTFMGLHSTCRDMARFGHLFLEQGEWNGTALVPSAWTKEATTSSTPLNVAYGYLWWLNRKGRIASPLMPTTGHSGGDSENGQLVPGAPDDVYFALGAGHQIIAVFPASGVVTVRLGPLSDKAGVPPFTEVEATNGTEKALVRR